MADYAGYVERPVRHEVAKESCSHSLKQNREPPMPLGESRDLNKERS